jgi:hypothetical protein
MDRLLERFAWGAGLCLLILSFALVSCAGSMEEEAPAEETAGEPVEEPPFDLAPTELPSGGPADGGAEATEPPPSTETQTAVPSTVEPTPDFGSVAYDVPEKMVREQAVEVILLVSPSEEADLVPLLEEELEEAGQAPQNVTATEVKVGRYMAAWLDSAPEDAFEIVDHQKGAETQELSEEEPKKWEWTVIPKRGGTHRLILRINRLVGEDIKNANPLIEEVHRDIVTVEVPFGLRVRDALGGFDLKWLAGVFIFPLFFYILSRRDGSKDKE